MTSLSTPGGEEGIDLADGTIAQLLLQLGINSPAELNGKPVSEVVDQQEQAAKAIDGQFSELATIAKQNPQAVLQVEEVPLDEMPAQLSGCKKGDRRQLPYLELRWHQRPVLRGEARL